MSSSVSQPLTARLVFILALGTAASVATLYFNQPLLPLLGHEFHAQPKQIGLLVTLTQLGYAAGILALVPLGDILNKKHLILTRLSLLALALVAVGLSGNLLLLFLGHFAIGLVSTAAQDFVPLAADLASDERRGQVIGSVMGGLLLGILVSRTFAGVVADHFGWRAVYLVAAGLIALIAGMVWVGVPSRPSQSRSSYGALMRSLVGIVRQHPALRFAVVTQGLMGAVFSAFWTVLAFQLTGPSFHLSTSVVGYFGLIGAAGALAAPLAGRLADRRGPMLNISIAIGMTFAAFVWMTLWPSTLIALILGAAVFDLGIQMSMVSHQSIIYRLDPAARSRINAVFVSGLFLFFAGGSLAGNLAFSAYGWRGLTTFCLCSSAGAYVLHRWMARSLARAKGARETETSFVS
jgi:predicted MFS family arabinose efflux permease